MIKAEKTYNCNCGKQYKHRQSLHTHKKTCDKANNKVWYTEDEYEEAIERNAELKLLLENEKKLVHRLKKQLKEMKLKYETEQETTTTDTDVSHCQ